MNFCPACGYRVAKTRPFQCEECGTWQWANPKPCAGVLLEYDGQILLLRRAFEPWKGYWDIPGGFCDLDEHPADAAVREVQEELGIEVELAGLLGMWMDTYGEGKHPDRTLNIYYLARWSGQERPVLTLDLDEASSAEWFDPDSLPPDIGFPNHQPAVVSVWAQVCRGERVLTSLPAR